MLLAIDIGNSNITLGGIQEGEILFEARLATDSTKTSDEYGVEIKDMLDLFGARVEEIRDCIVASVVPSVFNSVRNGIVKLTGTEPRVVGPGIKTGINILLEDPGATGADLIAAAVAAVDTYPTPLTVVDMGTATTIAVIDDGRIVEQGPTEEVFGNPQSAATRELLGESGLGAGAAGFGAGAVEFGAGVAAAGAAEFGAGAAIAGAPEREAI